MLAFLRSVSSGLNSIAVMRLDDAAERHRQAARPADEHPALLGHSMSGDIIVRYAQLHPDVAAVVAVSPYAPSITATTPRNLEIIVGGLEPEMVRAAALDAVKQAWAIAVTFPVIR